MSPQALDKVDSIIDKYGRQKKALISILQDIQTEYNYLPRESLVRLREKLSVPLTEIFGVVTFYNIFTLKPRGRHLISVCTGTACHVKGASRILEELERKLGIKTGGTTADLEFSLESIRCLGCCSLAPVIKIDDEIYGRVKQGKVQEILKEYE